MFAGCDKVIVSVATVVVIILTIIFIFFGVVIVQHPPQIFWFFFGGGNHIVPIRWIREGLMREVELPEVPVLNVRVEVYGIILHGIDGAFLFHKLQLKVIQLGCTEINANNGAFAQALIAF